MSSYYLVLDNSQLVMHASNTSFNIFPFQAKQVASNKKAEHTIRMNILRQLGHLLPTKTRRFPSPPHRRTGFFGIVDIFVICILLLSELNERSSPLLGNYRFSVLNLCIKNRTSENDRFCPIKSEMLIFDRPIPHDFPFKSPPITPDFIQERLRQNNYRI